MIKRCFLKHKWKKWIPLYGNRLYITRMIRHCTNCPYVQVKRLEEYWVTSTYPNRISGMTGKVVKIPPVLRGSPK